MSTLTAQTTALQGQVTTLTAENQALRAQVASSAATIGALVGQMFGDKADALAAAAARDMALAALTAARAASPNDPKLRQAQKAFDDAMADLRAGRFQQAVQGFREAYNTAQKILGR